MANLPIPDETTWIKYDDQTGAGPFSFSFSIFAKADLRVKVGNTELAQSGFTFTGTLIDTGYDGGSIELVTPAAAEDVLIWREVTPARASDFAPASSVSVLAVDAALDRLTAHAQDLRRDVDRSIKVTLDADTPAETNYDDMIAAAADAVSAEAIADIEAEGAAQVGLVETEGTTQVAAVEAAGDVILTPTTGSLAVAEAAAIAAVDVAGAAQIVLVEAAGDAEVVAVEDEGDVQVARIAATPASGQYETKAAGDAAGLATGAHFIVPAAPGSGFLVYRVTGSGTSTLVNTMADITGLAALEADLDGLYDLETPIKTGQLEAWTDDYGNAALIQYDDGTIGVARLTATEAVVEALSADEADLPDLTLDVTRSTVTGDTIVETWEDGYGLIAMRLAADGALEVARLEEATPSGSESLDPGYFDYDWNIFVSYGQSLSRGYNSRNALTTTSLYGSKMLSSGVVTYDQHPYTSATLVDLVEANVSDPAGPAGDGETPVSGAHNIVNQLIESENGIAFADHDFALIGAAAGVSGAAITSFVQGTTAYNRLLDFVTRVVALAAAANKTVCFRGVHWMQGESDADNGTDPAVYKAALIDLRSDLDTDVKAITGQTVDVQLFTYQTSGHSAYGVDEPLIALAQLEASEDDANIHCCGPVYQMDCSDSVHLTPSSSKWAGAYAGLAYKRVVIDLEAWEPLKPVEKIIQGSVCTLVFNTPAAPLVLDTTQVALATNYGFQLVESDGTPITISSVELSGPTRVKITASGTIPAGALVRGGWGPGGTYNAGRLTGPRINLRDSAGDSLIFDPTGIARPMHNYCVFFEI